MSRVKIAFFALIAFAVAVSAATPDPNLVNLMMPDANIVSGINVTNTLASPFGRYILSQAQANNQGFQNFIQQTGFDPTHDLTEIVAATAGTSTAPKALVAATGVFNTASIASAAKAAGSTSTTYKGVTIYTHAEQNGNTSGFAFLSNSLAVAGELSQVEAAIDRGINCATSCLSSTLKTSINTVSAPNDAWFMSTGPITNFFAGQIGNATLQNGLNGNLLQAIQQASGGVKFGDTITISGQAVTRSAQDANSLADVVRFLAGLVQMNQNGANPTVTLLNSMQLSTNGNTMLVSLSLPESQVEQLLMKGPASVHPRHRASVGK